METTKQCNKCFEHKSLTNFCKNKNAVDGYHWTCKTCIKEYQLSVKDKLKAYQKEYQKTYRKEHKEELAEYTKQWQKNNPERHRASVAKSDAKLRASGQKQKYHREYYLRQKLKKLNDQQQTSGTHL